MTRSATDCLPELDPAYELEIRLAAVDPVLRRRRGVYFTPRPVASYLVRSVDRLLEREFGLAAGLATEGVMVVDPACGSGVYLREVLEQCAGRPRAPALVGFDVLPESCEAARQTVAQCARLDAAQVLTLDPLAASEEEMARLLKVDRDLVGRRSLHSLAPPYVPAPPNAYEAREDVPPGRRELLIVLGNPPWSNFGRQNRGPWILDKLADYKVGLVEKKNNLGDDFIKFVRWGQYWIDQAGAGMLAFVTSNTYLAGLTHRAMRRSLLSSFSELYLYDLHGSSAKRDRTADGSPDENVFDVRSGVALSIFVKRKDNLPPRVHYAELRGSREQKLQTLAASDVSTTTWNALSPAAPMFFFVSGRGEGAGEYGSFLGLDELFGEYISGVQTKNDKLYTDFSRDELAGRMQAHLSDADPPFSADKILPYMTAPFDLRWIYYEPRLLGRARYSVMRHMLRPNVGLVFMRQSTTPGEYDHFLATGTLVSDRVFHSAHGAPFLAPLYLYDDSGRRPNLRPEAVEQFAAAWRLRFIADGRGDLCKTFGPEDVLDYVYAIVHGSDYRRRYDGQLRIDFPRVPIVAKLDTVRRLCQLGRELVELHVPNNSRHTPCAAADGTRSVPASLDVAEVPADVLAFRLGGYEVVRRWLKQRRGRELSIKESIYLTRLIQIARETTLTRRKIELAAR